MTGAGPTLPTQLTNQQRRTRQAILTACRELLDEGVEPSISVVAERALVARATIYRYFPALKHLLFEASLANSEHDIDSLIDETAGIDDPEERLATIVRAIYWRVSENEPSYRRLLQLSLENPEPDGQERRHELRGIRRVLWLEATLAPFRNRFEPAAYERLIHSLSIVAGIEAIVALKDISNLGADEAEQVVLWTTVALLRQALAE